ncbi:MAG TPA: hypothetical protein VKB41_08520 [Steroidobacteraceae bacterium]|nr:hypothetical protein [Steroidobacteraceae bacterium]
MHYLLRNIDRKLWKRVTAKAEAEGRTIRGLILFLLERYVSDSDALERFIAERRRP